MTPWDSDSTTAPHTKRELEIADSQPAPVGQPTLFRWNFMVDDDGEPCVYAAPEGRFVLWDDLQIWLKTAGASSRVTVTLQVAVLWREVIAEAFEAGAMSVHAEWLRAHNNGEQPPRGDPDFSEAARDFAALIADRKEVTHD